MKPCLLLVIASPRLDKRVPDLRQRDACEGASDPDERNRKRRIHNDTVGLMTRSAQRPAVLPFAA